MLFNAAVHWLEGTKMANIPSSSPLGVVLRYSSPLPKVRLLHMRKSVWLSSVSTGLPRYFFSRTSWFSDGVSFQDLSHLIHMGSTTSYSWAFCQSTIYVTGSTQTCTLVGYCLKICAMPGFDTIGFRTTVTKCVIMLGLGASRQTMTSSQTFE